jgi:hypothetical protein
MPDDTEANRYVRGQTYARRQTPTFEFKAGATGYTGGGYPRVRSKERREHTPGDGTDDVFVPIHRLAAVAWCYDAEWSIAEILADLGERDVHHELGFPSATVESELRVVDHDRHASLTQAERRAYAKDQKRRVEREQQALDTRPSCTECGDEATATVAGDEYCLDCAMQRAEQTGATIEM